MSYRNQGLLEKQRQLLVLQLTYDTALAPYSMGDEEGSVVSGVEDYSVWGWIFDVPISNC